MDGQSNFEYIWNQWVNPLVSDLYEQMDAKFKEVCRVEVRDLSELYKDAAKYYQNKREEVKRMFYGDYHKGESAIEHRMDFHKIGAILCRTMIEYKVISFDVDACEQYIITENISIYDTDWAVRNALINFRLAFYVSISFLYHAMLFEAKKENNVTLYRRLEEQGTLDLYNSSERLKNNLKNVERMKESFENCIVLDLAKRDIGNRSFDYLMYAIILYQLEEHNKVLLLNEMYSVD